MQFFVYILFSEKLKRFYVGTTDDVPTRLTQHNDSIYSHAFTTKGIPWQLFLTIECNSSKQAYDIESHIKNMKSKNYILNLKKYPEMIETLLMKY